MGRVKQRVTVAYAIGTPREQVMMKFVARSPCFQSCLDSC